jgi:hypothetical protein
MCAFAQRKALQITKPAPIAYNAVVVGDAIFVEHVLSTHPRGHAEFRTNSVRKVSPKGGVL